MTTGINPVATGGQPEKDAAVTTTEMAMAGTTKVLKPLIDSIFKVKKLSAEFVAEGTRLKVKSDKKCYDAYARVIGQNDIIELKQNDYELTELGISLHPRPTTQDIQQIMQAADIALADGRNGQAGITLDVWLYIKEKILNGANLKDIRLYLANAIRKNTEYQQAMKERNIQLQNEGLAKIQAQKDQGEQNKEQQRHQNAMQEAQQVHGHAMEQQNSKYAGDHSLIDHNNQVSQPQAEPQIT
jgi:hypothetical protein